MTSLENHYYLRSEVDEQMPFYKVYEVNTYGTKEVGNTTNTELNTVQL
jgi:hypothetical protein